ncbi:MAG: DNA gyrase subunit A [Candidatus Riflebacteria bacterium]|nr:DNA gyrase subunit A [Candidatus Riflebacteria bacterium]
MVDTLASNVIPVPIEDEMKDSYIDYAMSVIISRALPDARDGLKPVHRRILYAMHRLGLASNKAYKKSAAVVGEVIAKYHPHGDAAVYDSMVRMAQDFSLRYEMVDGQGNFGSVDGDPPAAYRYTEARLTKFAEEVLEDLDKQTVDFVPNFDESEREPRVLPSRIPTLLVDGSDGIAVGLATKIPPHNLGEVVDALLLLLKNKDTTIDELLKIVKGPDFPTGALILQSNEIAEAYRTGRGRVVVRARAEIEPMSGNRERIIVNEIPYQVNKAKLLEDTADLVRDKKIDGITDIRDESDRRGMRIVFEIRRGENAQVILNQLFKLTQLQTTFGVNMVALIDNRPLQLNLKQLCAKFLEHRREVVTRRTRFELRKAEDRCHLLEGLKIALDNIDAVVQLIRASKDPAEARAGLMSQFGLSQVQADAILEMRLQRLTSLETRKVIEELAEVRKTIARLKEILSDISKVEEVIATELKDVKARFGDERRSTFIVDTSTFDPRDLYVDETKVITVTRSGYIKSLPLDTYRKQHRGGKGLSGMSLKEEDFVERTFAANTFDILMFFTTQGKCFAANVFDVPEGSRTSKGRSIANLLSLRPDEKVTAIVPVQRFDTGEFIVMATKKGLVKRTTLDEYGSCVRQNGIIGLKFASEDDELVGVALTKGDNHIVLGSAQGQAIRFPEADLTRPDGTQVVGVPAKGRVSQGVKGFTLEDDDEVVGMEVAGNDADCLLVVTENGYGKRTEMGEYRVQSRGGKGVINVKVNQRNGRVAGFREVVDDDEVIVSTREGKIIRITASSISKIGRDTQGVRIIDLGENDKVISVTVVKPEPADDGTDPDQQQLPDLDGGVAEFEEPE